MADMLSRENEVIPVRMILFPNSYIEHFRFFFSRNPASPDQKIRRQLPLPMGDEEALKEGYFICA